MKKILSTLAAVVLSGAIASAAYLVPLTGPQDPSQINATINQLMRSINSGVNGLVANSTVRVTSAATTAEQTLYTTPIATSTLLQNGQALRLRCSGYMPSTTHAGTSAKLYYGTSSISTGNATTSGQSWDLALLVTYGASATDARYVGTGLVGTTVVTPVATENSTDNMASALNAKCTTTQGTASAGDVVMENFVVEQVK